MNRKTLLTVGLLSFVGLSLAIAVADVAGWRRSASESPAPDETAIDASAAPQFTAIYFHAPHRCPTCRNIEAFTHTALQPDIDSKQIAWQVADYTSPQNAKMVEKFDVITSTVVLTESRGGQVVRWQNVEQVWQHAHDQPEFVAFMQQAWADFRGTL